MYVIHTISPKSYVIIRREERGRTGRRALSGPHIARKIRDIQPLNEPELGPAYLRLRILIAQLRGVSWFLLHNLSNCIVIASQNLLFIALPSTHHSRPKIHYASCLFFKRKKKVYYFLKVTNQDIRVFSKKKKRI